MFQGTLSVVPGLELPAKSNKGSAILGLGSYLLNKPERGLVVPQIQLSEHGVCS
jgi:hypothetical protein